MKFRNTVWLIVILALLAGYFFLVEQKKEIDPSEDNDMIEQTITVFDQPENDVVELILSNGEQRTVIRRADEKSAWELVEPVHGPAQEDRVAFFTRWFASLNAYRVLTDTEAINNLADYGLTNPRAQGTMKLKDGQELTLHVGDVTPELTSVYSQVEGDDQAIYLVGILVPNYILDFLEKPPLLEPTPVTTEELAPTLAIETAAPSPDAP